MIRLKIKSTQLLSDVLYVITLIIAFLWMALGWLIMVPWWNGDSLSSKQLLPWQLGLAIWLGPWVIGGLGYLCHRTFHIEFIGPRKLTREILKKSDR